MALVKFINGKNKNKAGLVRAIDYILDENKTETFNIIDKKSESLFIDQLIENQQGERVINYITKDGKTSSDLITGVNCDPESAFNEMMVTKQINNKVSGRQFIHNVPSEGYNFNIIDLGVINDSNIKALHASSINLLCAGSKPYEIPYLKAALEAIKNELFVSLPLGSSLDLKDLKIDKDKIIYQKYTQNLFDGVTNQELFKKILGNHVFLNKSL